MDADSTIDFTAPPEQMTERKMRFQRVFIDLGHAHEQFQRFVGLAIQNEVEASQIVCIDRRRGWRAAISSGEAGEKPTRGSRHDE